MGKSLFYAIHDPTSGRVIRVGATSPRTVPFLAQPGEGAVTTAASLPSIRDDWVNPATGLLEQRPGLADVPAAKALVVDEDWPLAGVPDGTEVWIDGALAGTVDATGLTLSVPLAAVWQLRLVPPFPWKPADCEVTVS